MQRIIMHWSAGTHTVSALDRQHYHFIIDGSGVVHDGIHKPEANERPVSGKYAAHTLNCNTGSIGVAVAAMAGAVEAPFSPGKYPITEAQVDALAGLCAHLCARYGIDVTRRTVLSHAEVQPTLKITQRGKWDIAWLPGMAKPGDPVAVGDVLRARIIAARGHTPISQTAGYPTLKQGDKGEMVKRAQVLLQAAGFDPGPADGIYGTRTKAAAAAWQRTVGLVADGIIGAASWPKLMEK